jgi:hypothetical protein
MSNSEINRDIKGTTEEHPDSTDEQLNTSLNSLNKDDLINILHELVAYVSKSHKLDKKRLSKMLIIHPQQKNKSSNK